MKDWLTLTTDEKATARGGREQFENTERMDNCLRNVLVLLTGELKDAVGVGHIPTPATSAS